MAGRRVGGALIEILARVVRGEVRRFTLDSLREDVRRAGDTSPWASIGEILTEDVDDLTLPEFLRVVRSIRAFLLREAEAMPDLPRALIRRFAIVQHIVRTLTDRETLARMARMEPISMPDQPPSNLDRIGQLIRTGHTENSPHWELPVSSQLHGSRMASYFYVSGGDVPEERSDISQYLVAHDSDEFAFYLGFADRARPAGIGRLPIYLDGQPNPFEKVEEPIQLNVGEFFVCDGANPHFWFSPPNTVAFFVGASSNQMYRKPVAFRSENRDSVPGGSYAFYETRRRRKPKRSGIDSSMPPPAAPARMREDRTNYLFGKRLRRKRDGFGLSANEIQKLKTRGRGITANIIGKIENDAFSNLRVQLVTEFAEALDLPLVDLFPREPVELRALSLSEMRTPEAAREAFARGTLERPYAVVPHLVHPIPSSDMITFREGEADVVLLPLEGAVDVYVAPDPLLLALELVHDFATHISDPQQRGFDLDGDCIRLSQTTIERLKRRQLLWHDRVEERQAYHFNAALPHAVLSATGNRAATIAVTTRGDVHLPEQWLRGGNTQHAVPQQRVATS